MEIISIYTYRDGGTRVIETDEGFFCIPSPLSDKKGIFCGDNAGIFFNDGGELVTDVSVMVDLIKALSRGCEIYMEIKRIMR